MDLPDRHHLEPNRQAAAKFGLLPMIIGSLQPTFGSLVIGVPLGAGCGRSLWSGWRHRAWPP